MSMLAGPMVFASLVMLSSLMMLVKITMVTIVVVSIVIVVIRVVIITITARIPDTPSQHDTNQKSHSPKNDPFLAH